MKALDNTTIRSLFAVVGLLPACRLRFGSIAVGAESLIGGHANAPVLN